MKNVWILLVLSVSLQHSFGVAAENSRPKPCQQLLTQPNTPLKTLVGLESFERTPDVFQYRDSVFGFEFFGMLMPGGILFINAILINSELKIRSRYSGAELYDQMMTHFGVENIHEIQDSYYAGSVNERLFHEALQRGLNPTEAIKTTWSGKLANKYGFTVIKDIHEDPLPMSATSHAPTAVHARFLKPE